MFELPLFPLNSVLFPHMPIKLHIFEERYKQMIQRCLAENASFGVVLIEQGVEANGPLATPHRIGCTARITEADRLSQGRLNIVALGGERFRIETLDDTTYPYLCGQVELFPMPDGPPAAIEQTHQRLRGLVGQYLERLGRVGQTSISLDKLPAQPLLFAYLAASLLQVPVHQKQPLLEATDTGQFMADLCTLYRRELSLLDVLLQKPDPNNPHTDYRLN